MSIKATLQKNRNWLLRFSISWLALTIMTIAAANASNQEAKWTVLTERGYNQLASGNIASAEKSLKLAFDISRDFQDGDDRKVSSLKALALLKVGEAVDFELKTERALNRQKRDMLYGVVILIVASILLSVLMKYGPQKPRVVARAEHWIANKKEEITQDSTTQVTAVMFSLIMFAAAALTLLAVVSGFMWLLACVSPPSDGQYEKATPSYDSAINYMQQASSLEKHKFKINRKDVMLYYADFLGRKGKRAMAETVLNKVRLLPKSGK